MRAALPYGPCDGPHGSPRRRHRCRAEASAPPWPGASTPTGPASSSPTWVTRAGRRRARAGPSACTADVATEAGNVRADRAGRGGVRPGRPVLRQRRHRRWHRPRARPRTTGSRPSTSTSTPTAGRPSTCSPGGWPAARATSARRRRRPDCWPQIGSAPYTLTKRAAVAFAEWLADHVRRPGPAGQLPVPAGREHRHAPRRRRARRRRRRSCAPPASCSNRNRSPTSSPTPSPTSGSSSFRTPRSTTSCSARPTTPTAGWPACASCRPACRCDLTQRAARLLPGSSGTVAQ